MPDFTSSDSFRKNGFVLIENVLDCDEVARLRVKLSKDFSRHTRTMETIRYFLENKELHALQFNPKIIGKLKEVVGDDFTYVNNIEIQCNSFGLNGRKDGWHPDCGSEVADISNQYLFESGYLFGKVGVFLQDNTLEFGGGIDALVGGHRAFRNFGNPFFNYVFWKLASEFQHKVGKKITVPVKAGSAVYFDSRLPHRSSPGTLIQGAGKKMARVELPPEHSKYVLYWEATDSRGARDFLRNAQKRAILEDAANGSELFFTEYLGYVYPEHYPSSYKRLVELSASVRIASIDPMRAMCFRTLYQNQTHDLDSIERIGLSPAP